eukprot:TRINITY_DN7109_c0_g2_i1.p2 TRINITY_DN7109_c0_g2~~TRINITY_DN7109_c0_g2_i1.p2  ORF type:complete len:300 (-),score=61.15 TRINITY_DN7109_c0_g2_i1:135-1034(-)
MNLEEFGENYFILEHLSTNSTSEVVLVFNNVSKGVEVIKILKKRINKNNLEFKMATELNHKNIIKSLENFQIIKDDNTRYTVLKFKKYSSDLFDYVENHENLSKTIKIDIFKQMVRAIKYLHELKYAHGDVKLENFLVEPIENSNGRVKLVIIDFEYVVHQQGKYCKNFKPSTLYYRAPETFRKSKSKKINAFAADIYALGITLHTLLTGFMPYSVGPGDNSNNNNNESGSNGSGDYSGEFETDVDRRHMRHQIKKGKVVLNEDLSKIEADLLKKMLNKNPKKRITINGIINHPFLSSQ